MYRDPLSIPRWVITRMDKEIHSCSTYILSKTGNEERVVNIKFVLPTSWAKKHVECMGVPHNKNYKGMV